MKKVEEELHQLTQSPLYTYRTENKYIPVVGSGSDKADIVFIGEAPGKNEAETGRPFCGAAGKILDELLASVSISCDDVYITNIIKDRPPQNRDPSPDEVETYAPFLDRQIDIIQPKMIATLGRFSTEYIMRKFGLENKIGSMGEMRGRSFRTQTPYDIVHIVPLYHPAASLYNRKLRDTLFEDFKQLKL